VIPGVRADLLKALFAGAGWKVLEAKYGTQLESAMAGPGGSSLRRRIDEMSNEEYQSLIRLKDGAELRSRISAVADAKYRSDILRSVKSTSDEDLRDLIANLGGHDLPKLIEVLNQADAVEDAPAVVFAYTVKGYGLPMAGDPLNHSQLLTQAQMEALLPTLGDGIEDVWAGLPEGSPAWELVKESADRLRESHETDMLFDPANLPAKLDARHPETTSTQEALGRALARLADIDAVRDRLVTMSPDVATSTHLSGWINKVGVFAFEEGPEYEIAGQRMLKWHPTPEGHHIELGISEMNLIMCLGQFGLSYELTGQHLIPIGTVYDPFVCRGLDALIYSLYVGSKMIFAGTPAGVSLSPEGGAHQSTITPSIGIELPGLVLYEPAFATELEWILLEAIKQVCDREHGLSTYLRLSTKPIDQTLMREPLERFGEEELRRQVLAGGYRLIDRTLHAPELAASDAVNIFVGGIMAPEAIEAAGRLHEEGVAANVIVTTSTDKLFGSLQDSRRALLRNASGSLDLGHLETLIPIGERRAPIVTVQDGASHAMSFLGSVFGVPVVPLGVDEFGQSGSRADLYEQTGIDADEIVNAAMLSLELGTALRV